MLMSREIRLYPIQETIIQACRSEFKKHKRFILQAAMKKRLKKQFGIRLGEEQIKNLEEIANEEERSFAAVIRRFIDDGIKKKKADTGKTEGTSEL